METSDEVNQQKFDLIVIGAGVSGLTAARSFLKRNNKASVIVLEAKERIGGRTFGEKIECSKGKVKKWDLGGQWVGDYQTNVMHLLEELDIDTYPQYTNGKKVMQLSDNKVKYYNSTIPPMPWYTLLDFGYLLYKIDKITKNFPVDDPYSLPNAQKWDNITVAEAIDQMSFFPALVKDSLNAALATLFGADATHLSFLYFLYFAASSGGLDRLIGDTKDHAQRLRIDGGAYQIADRLAESIGFENIRLNCPVTSINQENETTIVTCVSGEKLECKKVILAIPPALIAQIQFTPSLNSGRKHVLQSMPLGHLLKFIVTYEKPFWRDNGFSGEIVTSGGESIIPNCTRGPNCIVFDGTNNENDAALVGFIGGCQHFEYSTKSYHERSTAVTTHLAKCFGPQALEYISYSEKDWSNEPYNGGCPSSIGGTGFLSLLVKSVKEKHINVHFAGTESADCCVGYISGAVQSGQRAALEVTEALSPGSISEEEMRIIRGFKTKTPNTKTGVCFSKFLYTGILVTAGASLYLLIRKRL